MPNLHLTDIAVRSLKPHETPTTYFDVQTPGFFIRVGKRSKSWGVMKGRERARIKIGAYPATSLADARTAAKRLLIEPYERPAAISFQDARTLFLETHYLGRRERTRREAKRLLEKHATFAGELAGLSDVQISKVLDRLAHVPSEQLHFFRTLRTMLRWATRPPRRFLKHSPLEGYAAPSREKVGDRVLSDNEIRAVWLATEDGSTFSRIVRLLLLTGQRKTPIGSLRSDWLSGEGVLFPATVMKAGREFLLPLAPAAASLLPERAGVVFPARGKDAPFAGYSAATKALCKRSGVHFNLHSLRRTAATNWGKLKIQPHVIQALLAHSWGGVTGRYNRYDYYDDKKVALERWEAHFRTITG